jgi:gamma-glutamyltranspeptidase / glutathione hydrolase
VRERPRADERDDGASAARLLDVTRPLAPIPLARGSHGAVVAPHHLATSAGLAILRAGGSAVDAAIAANAVLAVVDGISCGIGGDAFWLIWDAQSGRQLALNGSGRSSVRADPAALRGVGLERLPLRGGLSITVPGAVRSWGDAHDRFGRLPRADLLGPAIELADGGFPAWDGFINAVELSAGRFATALDDDNGWRSVYRPEGRAWRPGEQVRLPNLAATLTRIAETGWDEFYAGDTAAHQARALAAAGSAIGLDDLAAHRSSWTEPIATDYRGVRVTSHPPNSSGFVALEILNILEQFEPPPPDVFADGIGADLHWVHLGIEASKLAMADRDAHLTDPEAYRAPLERLLDKGYAEELAARIDPTHSASPPAATVPRGGGTIWLGVVDHEGNAVSLIESNYMGFGSGVVDPVTGIAYQNRGSFFSLDDDHPNVLGPAKRTLHTLLPGMLFRDGRPWVLTGSMGGDAQPQIHAQVVSALIDGGVDVATAVAMPRWFVEPSEHFEPPDAVRAEPRFRPGLIDGLEALGHPVLPAEPYDSMLGHCHAIELIDGGPAADGSLAAATDPRSAGLPAVW